MSYHVSTIPTGVIGERSKIEEELLELKDAEDQQNKIMVLNELSDLVGAVECYVEKNFPGFTLQDLVTMSNATRRAFESGHRTPKKS